ncbi:hypothetical protein ZOSMA_29G00850 [Zostera marina]|uniref:Uncharacterized protein n=1 Tax=Zostera marina TaxID=29655 RepID=A0A0K9PBT8_ZOSMR|nr:hypothetical protein ZOSMA_29G00850 [Zostera marina]
MNRSFRAPEVQKHPQQRSRSPLPLQRGKSLGAVIKEKDEELALFLEMRKRERERNSNLLGDHSDELDRLPGSKPGTSPIFKIVPTRRTFTDEFLGGSDAEKNDYDWLLTPPGTPLFPYLEKESPPGGNIRTPKTRPTVLKSRLSNLQDPATRGNSVSRQPTSSSSSSSSFVGNRRSSTSGGPTSVSSRPTTPTRRSTLPAASRSSRPSTPTSRLSLPSNSRPVAPPPRSSTPVRSSTPTSRSSAPAPPLKKPVSRAATPTRRPSAPVIAPKISNVPNHSLPVVKNVPVMSKTSVPTRGSSPTVKSRPWKSLEIPGFSADTPPNLRTSLPERPLSASRGRPGAPTSRSSSVEPGPVARPRRQSCSPLRGRAPNGNNVHQSGSSVPATARSRVNGNGKSNPSLIRNKTSDKVNTARKLPPPKQSNNQRSGLCNPTMKSSPDSSGFGRSMSKKSLDMAMRHMDIRRSIPNNLRPLMTNVPASSMYSVRLGSAKSRGISVSDSPLATSSNASSDSVNNSNIYHEGNELEDYDIRISKTKQPSSTAFLAR